MTAKQSYPKCCLINESTKKKHNKSSDCSDEKHANAWIQNWKFCNTTASILTLLLLFMVSIILESIKWSLVYYWWQVLHPIHGVCSKFENIWVYFNSQNLF